MYSPRQLSQQCLMHQASALSLAPKQSLGGALGSSNLTQCRCKRLEGRKTKRRRKSACKTKAMTSQGVPRLVWHSRGPLQALQLTQQQLQAALGTSASLLRRCASPELGLPHSPLHTRNFGSVMAGGSPLGHMLRLLREVFSFFAQPPGGYPVGVVRGVPGWQMKVVRGSRRWLGLRPGRLQPVPDPGPWWTPSGVLHLVQNVPTGVWLVLAVLLARVLMKVLEERREARDKLIQQQTLVEAAKSTDLRVQKNRMMRALGGTVETDVAGVAIVPAAEHTWQDPSEWDPATHKQWQDFMQKSRAMKLKQDQWWRIGDKDDTPYHKVAHDKLRDAGQLPDYS